MTGPANSGHTPCVRSKSAPQKRLEKRPFSCEPLLTDLLRTVSEGGVHSYTGFFAPLFPGRSAEKESFVRNITLSIPDHVYINARTWAAHNDMSLSAAVRALLLELIAMPGPALRARMTERERALALQKAAKRARVPLKPSTAPATAAKLV